MSQEPKTDTHSFWAQVDVRGPDECWPWLGCRTKLGYGRVMIGGVRKLAHRWALYFETGYEPADRGALHSCDNPSCVNPKHLRWGTQSENISDRVERGRNGSAKGVKNGSAKLDPTKVRKILADERPDREIAADYGVAQSAIWAIKHRKIWRWVDAMDADQGGAVYLSGVLSDPKKEERQVLACQ